MPQIPITVLSQTDAQEQPYCKTRVLGSINGNGSSYMRHSMTTRKLIGRTTASVNYTGFVTANPSNQWYWTLGLQSLTLADLEVDGQMKLVYWVKFWHRKLTTDA